MIGFGGAAGSSRAWPERARPSTGSGRASLRQQSNAPASLLATVDHLVYATPDLATGVERLQRLLGVQATPGGQHPGAGTRNALIALGAATYLEIIGPDPEQPKPPQARRFGIDDLTAPKLVTWAAKSSDLETLTGDALRQGIQLGPINPGSRRTPQGVLLAWRLTVTALADGIVPFFIDWGQTPHPARSAATGATLVDLRAEHPDAERVQKVLSQLGLELPVHAGARPALIATISSPRGRVELR
jgi:glyoxalase-like protein